MKGTTAQNGQKTAQHTRHSAITILNKDPAFDYSMRRRQDIESGDSYGYEAIGAHNYNGEVFGATPYSSASKAGSKELRYIDTIACKRSKDISRMYQAEEDEAYNNQIYHVMTANKRAKDALRKLDPDSTVTSKSTFAGPGMTQRKGPTEEEVKDGQ